MFEEFLKYVKNNSLVSEKDRVLLAVSGGIDSMVMADLFFKTSIKTGIIHCNFSLRGKESDKDEELVRNLAKENNVPFFSKRFDTKAYSKKKGISVQMAARDLRYTWFEETREKNGYNSVAVAHNLNDNIETLLVNLIRGTGIAGLAGMKPYSNKIIRPLLFATRNSIEEYSNCHNIIYREDKSNAETKYIRNKIRHLILPVLKDINPAVEISLNETSERLRSTYNIISEYIENIGNDIISKEKDVIKIQISSLQNFLPNQTVIYELFRPYGIASGNLSDLYNIIKGKTGGQIFTGKHRILKNRNEIIITGRSENENEVTEIFSIRELRKIPLIKSVSKRSVTSAFTIPSDPATACLDFQKISFPIEIRKWKPGDYFYPLGMNNRKKLSDYFTDRKFSRIAKENVRIIESAGHIVWIIGERIDNRFRITGSTREALIIKIRDSR
ncbi:MAG: tRNA lysidine(34) synthetase TilS [Bacteroidales bacterium]|nr:tRNA lysidine(34) synthetase TilS [Bacteroidales bacterium]